MRVFGCFGGTPEKERIQSLRTDSPAKSVSYSGIKLWAINKVETMMMIVV